MWKDKNCEKYEGPLFQYPKEGIDETSALKYKDINDKKLCDKSCVMFRNFNNQFMCPFIIYADFECNLEKLDK